MHRRAHGQHPAVYVQNRLHELTELLLGELSNLEDGSTQSAREPVRSALTQPSDGSRGATLEDGADAVPQEPVATTGSQFEFIRARGTTRTSNRSVAYRELDGRYAKRPHGYVGPQSVLP
jgi:hypothetical protein